jgi:hypothetical protein
MTNLRQPTCHAAIAENKKRCEIDVTKKNFMMLFVDAPRANQAQQRFIRRRNSFLLYVFTRPMAFDFILKKLDYSRLQRIMRKKIVLHFKRNFSLNY